MCGIVGLFLKDAKLEPQLGSMLQSMLVTMCERGPDSAGFAIYGAPGVGAVKLTLRGEKTDFHALSAALGDEIGVRPAVIIHATHAVVTIPEGSEAAARAALAVLAPEVSVVSVGRRMEIYKEVGRPDAVAEQFGLARMSGTHAIAHTRMATESAVTTKGAHPFSTGLDQCLVHNGSLSNHNAVRRELVRHGIRFETDNDTEVAAGYLTHKLGEGIGLRKSLESTLSDLDGFFTFVVGTDTGFGVLRDPIACKPAVMAETEQWVAFGTEYRALVDLPGIGGAKVWEPEPATVYMWERA